MFKLLPCLLPQQKKKVTLQDILPRIAKWWQLVWLGCAHFCNLFKSQRTQYTRDDAPTTESLVLASMHVPPQGANKQVQRSFKVPPLLFGVFHRYSQSYCLPQTTKQRRSKINSHTASSYLHTYALPFAQQLLPYK